MNEEIKEILDEINKLIIPNEKWEEVKNYITNLQEENEFLKLNNPEMNIEHFRIVKENKRKIDNLRKENKELKQENQKLVKVIDELEKEIWKIRQLTFTKYNSNEWNNCLSFNDDILPIINKLTELKGGSDEKVESEE